MVVGEILLSAFLQVLFDRLASRELLNFVSQLQGGLDSELKKWEDNLMMIQSVLCDAEEKQLTNVAVKLWLDDLRDLAYDAEDILDEFATEASRRKLKAEEHDQPSSSKIQNVLFPSACFSFLNPSTVVFNMSMHSKIKSISNRFKELCEKIIVLGLLQGITSGGASSTTAQYRPPTSSVPTESAVFGRDEDKARILELVLSDEQSVANISVIPIIGMAGIGKTTLAREVYNDKAVKDFKFDIKVWICVSDVFDVLSISKTLLRKITSRPCDEKDFDEVQTELKRAVERKKLLLVLDDVWNENDSLWETLKAPFMAAAPNSKIIVTTRHANVASTMRPVEHYNLKLLPDDDCWFVFTTHAIEGRAINTSQFSELFRKRVIEKCGGLPLAAKTLGGLIRSKRDDAWDDILNNNIWDLPKESGILPVLRLSYHYLPSHLKRCFAYSAIFPKDYEFEKEELVLLWIAEGIIQQPINDYKQIEDWGSQCFDDLLSRSIFQQSSSHKFAMHDLIHDLAQLVSGETILRLEEANKQSRRLERARHSSYILDEFDGRNKFKVLYEVKHLRTLLPVVIRDVNDTHYITNLVLSDLIPKCKKLRVLSLAGYYITQIPNSVKDLRLLRYLNVAGTMIKSLPESTNLLLNLQVLILRNCSCLTKLPNKLKNLINLHHLDIKGADLLKEMPLGMNELKNLYMLSNFIVGKVTGSSLKDLRHLKFLRGELCISGLENVNDPRDAREARLCEKPNLEALVFEWGSHRSNTRHVLNALQPHENIKRLAIRNYGGVRFSSWIGDPSFSKMEVLELEKCENCSSLPSLGLLSFLKHLSIKGMRGLKYIGSEIYGEGCSKPFRSLETLHFDNLQEWEYWDTNIKDNEYVEVFSCLREFSLVGCHKLSGKLPELLPSLESLVVRDCAKLVVSLSSFPMLCKLEIDKCKGLMYSCSIDSQWVKSMTISNSSLDIYGYKGMVYNISPAKLGSLLESSVTISNMLEFGKLLKQGFQKVETLAIGDIQLQKAVQGLHFLTDPDEVSIEENCLSLISFPEINFHSNNLRSLKIENSKDLKSLPEEMMGNNAQVEWLYISHCDSLKFITRSKLPSSLKKLEIWFCQNMQLLVVDEEDASSSSSSSVMLKHLMIVGCPELTTLASGIQLLQVLEYLYIRDCPKLESIPNGLHNLKCLQWITICNCPSLVCFPEAGLPSSILHVTIGECEKLKALPDDMHKLNYLQELHISECPSIVLFPEEGLPNNLKSLKIEDAKIYKALLEWGLHRLTVLRQLQICGCHDAESFPDEEIGMTLPTSLTELRIWLLPRLKYLSNSMSPRKLTTLEYLEIYDCPNLNSFPKAGLPSSLLQLYISNCPLLKKQCKRSKGKEWSKISYIPCVKIDGKFIYDLEEEE